MSECEIDVEGTKRWYKDSKLHREDGPAIEWLDGTKKWYQNGWLHREDGPAIEQKEIKQWYFNGLRHREGGPAFMDSKGRVEYWINGVELTEIEYFVRYGVVNE